MCAPAQQQLRDWPHNTLCQNTRQQVSADSALVLSGVALTVSNGHTMTIAWKGHPLCRCATQLEPWGRCGGRQSLKACQYLVILYGELCTGF